MSYNVLPPKCEEIGFYLVKNKLYISFKDYYFSIEKNKSKYLYSWEIKPDKSFNSAYAISETLPKQNFITFADSKRNKQLIDYLREYNEAIGKDEIGKFFKNILIPLNKYKVKNLLDENYNIKESSKEFEEVEDKNLYKTFNDYSDDVKEEAKKLLKSGKFFDECLDSVSWKHKGDQDTTKTLLLSCGSLFIKEPVHQNLNNEKGEGKTDVNNYSVKKIIPKQYIVELTNFSDKYIYYNAKNLNPEYNIYVIDDMILTPTKIEFLKEITDNNKKNKTLKTLIDQKVTEFELKGYHLTLMNRAKTDTDTELFDRLYLNRLETSEKHKKEVKHQIKQNNYRNTDFYLKKKNLILKCAWQRLIDNEIKVFNPYLAFFNVIEHENRNINHYNGFIEANTFINQCQRTKINNITIGSLEDVTDILKIVSKDFQTQKYKLDDIEKRILEHLRENPDINTYNNIAKSLKLNRTTIQHKIKGRDETIGLETKGLVNLEYIDKENVKKGVMIHLVENKNNVDTLITSDYESLNAPLYAKWVIINSFLEWLHILINNKVVNILTPFLEKEILDLNNYGDVCLFLKKAEKLIIGECIYIQDEKHCELKDLNFHNDFMQNKFNEFVEKNEINILYNGKNSYLCNHHENSLNMNQSQKTTSSLNTDNLYSCNQLKEDIENMISGYIQEVKYTSFDELCAVFSEIKGENIIINSVLDLAYNKNEITIYEKLTDKNEFTWSNITTNKPENVFKKSIYYLATGKTKKELISSMANIIPDYDIETSKIKAIDGMLDNNLLKIDTNDKLLITEKFKETMKT